MQLLLQQFHSPDQTLLAAAASSTREDVCGPAAAGGAAQRWCLLPTGLTQSRTPWAITINPHLTAMEQLLLLLKNAWSPWSTCQCSELSSVHESLRDLNNNQGSNAFIIRLDTRNNPGYRRLLSLLGAPGSGVWQKLHQQIPQI